MPAFKVIIIGGGLAGALLANGLINNDVDVTVYERDQEESRREGYQIRLGEASLSGFRACLKPSQIREIEQKFGISSDGKEIQSTYTAPCVYSTKLRPALDLGKLPNYSVSTAISRTVLRNFLVHPVREHGRIRFNKAFSHYSIIGDPVDREQVRVHFLDGFSDVCDVLVAADGSGSKINQQIGLNNIVEIDSHWTFVCKGDLPPQRVKRLPDELQKGPILLFHQGITLYYALYMPHKQDAETESNVLFDYDHNEASFYWSLLVPKGRLPNVQEADQTSRLQMCLDCVKDWAPEFTTMLSIGIGDSDSAGVSLIPLRASTKPSVEWRRDLQQQRDEKGNRRGHSRVWLIGDAIHAMQPNRGMGGNQSMYDCLEILPPLLELNAHCHQLQMPPSSDQVQAALRKYENKMINRAFKWVAKSGGTSVPSISFDGILGLLVYTLSTLFLPVVSMAARLFLAIKETFR